MVPMHKLVSIIKPWHTSTTDKYFNRVDVDAMKEELEKFRMPVLEEKEICKQSTD